MKGRITRWFETSRGSGVILILLLLCFWQFSALYIMDTPTWPPVTSVLTAWFENIADGTLIVHLLATLWRQTGVKDGRFDTAAARPIARCGYRGDYAELGPMFEMFRPAS